jgi:hypothetical protein
MIKLIVHNIDGNPVKLDVDQETRIVLQKRFVSLLDIDQRRADYTNSFPLPRTSTNDEFFGQFGDPGNFGEQWSPDFRTPAWLVENDNLIVEGVLELEASDPKLNRYNVTVSGTTSSIKNILGEKFMSALDFTDLAYLKSQIASTWSPIGSGYPAGFVSSRTINGTPVSLASMRFPIHDFGFGYGLYKKNGSANTLVDITSGTGAGTPFNSVILNRTIPAFNLFEMLFRLFTDQYGIKLSGSFFDESEGDEIFVQADNALSAFIAGVELFAASVSSSSSIDGTIRAVKYSTTATVAGFDNVNNEYTAPQAGTYYFNISQFQSTGSGTFLLGYQKDTGAGYGSLTPVTSAQTIGTTFSVSTFGVTLAAGDKIRMSTQVVTGSGNVSVSASSLWNFTSVTLTGTTVNPLDYWANHKQIDFFKMILARFNVIPWFKDSNELVLDTYDYYFANYGEIKNWTDKIDVDSIVTKPINRFLRNPVHLGLDEANNTLNNSYRDVVGREYGDYFDDLAIPFADKSKDPIKDMSAAVIQNIDPENNNGVRNTNIHVAKYYSTEDNVAYKSPGLQLMYFNGLRTGAFKSCDGIGDTVVSRSSYPFFSNFRQLSTSSPAWAIESTTLDLNFTWYDPPVISSGTGQAITINSQSEKGLFNRYFKNMILERYSEANKYLEFTAVLDPVDVATFNFADRVVTRLNGSSVGLRILELNDYVPGAKVPVKVKAMLLT